MFVADVPIVDLTDANAAVESIARAASTSGFFYVRDPRGDVGRGVTADMFRAARSFFDDLTSEEKQRAMPLNAHNRGYTRYQEETLDSTGAATEGDTKEGFYIGREASARETFALVGPNVWPDETDPTHGERVRGFRAAMETYYEHARSIGMLMLPIFAKILNVEETFFDEKWRRHNCLLRPLKYSAVASDASAGRFAAGAHSDYGALTILKILDDAPGLEILTADGTWYAVPPEPDVFIVNFGDLMERWSNGKLRSTKHRVMTSGISERYSCAFFFEPDYDTIVEPIASDAAPKYEPIRFGDYLIGRYNETHEDFAKSGENAS